MSFGSKQAKVQQKMAEIDPAAQMTPGKAEKYQKAKQFAGMMMTGLPELAALPEFGGTPDTIMHLGDTPGLVDDRPFTPTSVFLPERSVLPEFPTMDVDLPSRRQSKRAERASQLMGMMNAASGEFPELKDFSSYNDPGYGSRDFFDDMRVDTMTDRGLRQLDHAFDLTKHSVKQPKSQLLQERVETHRGKVFDAMAGMDFEEFLESSGQQDGPEFMMGDAIFNKQHGPQVFRAQQQSRIDNNRPMNSRELKTMSSTFAEQMPEIETDLSEKVKTPDALEQKPVLKGQVEKQDWVSPHGKGMYTVDDSGSMTWNQLLDDWYFEKGDAARSFDATHPITQDLMKDQGVADAREKWKKGQLKPDDSHWHVFGLDDYARELGSLDGTGSVLGSYEVFVQKTEDGKTRFDVYNNTGLESGSHNFPSLREGSKHSIEDIITGKTNGETNSTWMPKSILNNRERSLGGPGGTFKQHYFWYE